MKQYKVEKWSENLDADYGTMCEEDVKLIVKGYKKTDKIGDCEFYQRKGSKTVYIVTEVK